MLTFSLVHSLCKLCSFFNYFLFYFIFQFLWIFFFFFFPPILVWAGSRFKTKTKKKSKTGILLIVGKMSPAFSFILGQLIILFCFCADGFGVQGTDGLTVSDWELWCRIRLFIVCRWMTLSSDPGPACLLWNVICITTPVSRMVFDWKSGPGMCLNGKRETLVCFSDHLWKMMTDYWLSQRFELSCKLVLSRSKK